MRSSHPLSFPSLTPPLPPPPPLLLQYLCLSLLKNSSSSMPVVSQLSASIFLTLVHKFRGQLKAEVGVFLPLILLKPFEPPLGTQVGHEGMEGGRG